MNRDEISEKTMFTTSVWTEALISSARGGSMEYPKKLLIVACLVMLCCILGRTEHAFSFVEEPITFKDPKSAKVWDDPVSTIHSDLVYAMAIAAGFSDKDAATIEIWDQLVDAEELGPGNVAVYTNCIGSTQPAPNPADVCPDGYGEQVWPIASIFTEKRAKCATSRYGPYAPFFHFPHQTWAEDGQFRLWGWGYTKTLNGYAVYAWGDTPGDVFGAKCRYIRPEVIHTGIEAGTLKAFAMYLHVLADSYSHLDCLNALANLGFPWGNHTFYQGQIPTDACDYNPQAWYNSDTHGQEFGTGIRTSRTDAAALAVYDELVARSIQREGEYLPLPLDSVLTSVEGQPTLRSALRAFVHNWNFQNEQAGAVKGEYAAKRRAYAEQIAVAAKTMRKKVRHKWVAE
jgi:hypothetical protein